MNREITAHFAGDPSAAEAVSSDAPDEDRSEPEHREPASGLHTAGEQPQGQAGDQRAVKQLTKRAPITFPYPRKVLFLPSP